MYKAAVQLQSQKQTAFFTLMENFIWQEDLPELCSWWSMQSLVDGFIEQRSPSQGSSLLVSPLGAASGIPVS